MEYTQSTINFDDTLTVSVANRDYGLIRITQRSTPFPCAKKTLSTAKIVQRLGVEALEDDSGSTSGSEAKLSICPLKKKSTSTPHPNKGIELNPKVLARNMLTNKAQRTNYDGASLKSFSTITGIFSHDLHPGFVSSALKPSNNKGAFRDKGAQSKNNEKRVSWVIPNKSLHFVSSQRQMLNFNERRRLFNLGEYTIAKNGKKMSEVLMAGQPQPDTSMEHMDKADWQAHVEITSFINNHGYSVAESGHTTHVFRNSTIHWIQDCNKSTSNLILIKNMM